MNWPTIRHVLDVIGNGQKDGVSISYSIITNGSLVTKDVSQRFKEFEIPVVVSYDSPSSAARPLSGGRDSHAVIRRGLETSKRFGNRVILNAALTESTFAQFNTDLVDFAFGNGIYEVGVVLRPRQHVLSPAFTPRDRGKALECCELCARRVYLSRAIGIKYSGHHR